jgi:DNA-binding response OmpR family regulator
MTRVLVVEDDINVRRLLQGVLADEGYLVVGVSTGEHALFECAVSEPHLILLDLNLGDGATGKHFLSLYRDRLGGRARVIVISGVGRRDPMALGLVADEFVGKPFDLPALLRCIREVLRDPVRPPRDRG